MSTSTTPIPTPTTITLLGSTGLTGSATLQSLLSSPRHPFTISTFTRSSPSSTPSPTLPSTTHSNHTFSDLAEAVTSTQPLGGKGGVYVSCLGTTRGAAGGVEEQRKIDLDLNRDLAKRAREDGCSMAIIVSSGGANAKSYMAYPQMKGQLEEDVKGMDFEKTVILRPALLLGSRNESRPAEFATQKLFRGMGMIGLPTQLLSIEASDVGDCIAYLATHPPSDKVSTIANGEMIQLAKKWRDEGST